MEPTSHAVSTLDPSGQVSELDLQCFLVMCGGLCCWLQWPVTFALVMVLLAAFMLMQSRLGKHANRHALGAMEYLNSNGIALCAAHEELALSAAWTPRYVALSAFRQEALGAIEKKLQVNIVSEIQTTSNQGLLVLHVFASSWLVLSIGVVEALVPHGSS